SISADGVLAYRAGIQATGLQLTWFHRQGKILGEVGEPAAINQVVLSPDAARVATVRTAGQEDIWLLEFARSVTTRFIFEPRRDNSPVWSPDGNRIVFQSGSGTVDDFYQKPSNSASDEQLLLRSEAQKQPTSWSRDGRFLLYATAGLNSKLDIW